jgi:acetyl esterase/lipase
MKKNKLMLLPLPLAMLGAALCLAQNALPPLPAPAGVPAPGPSTSAPYAPQPILPGGVVVTLFPPGSPFLKMDRVREAEQYNMNPAAPGRINSIVNIHNPSIEVHTVDRTLNTGAAVILIPGGGHNTLNVGSEGADFVPFFYNYGVNTIILRNRLRRDGYNPRTDEVYDTQQAIRLVRAHAKDWNIDPNKIGIMGFSAGAELATAAAVLYDDFDKQNNGPGDPLAGVSSRPDFVGVIYPGPTPFARYRVAPPIPRNVPPSFIASAGSDDQIHAIWADEYFSAMLAVHVPNLEMHIYANGRHPGDPLRDGSRMTGGLSDRKAIPFGTWQFRFIDWFRDLGFLEPAGVETKAAKDIAFYLSQPAVASTEPPDGVTLMLSAAGDGAQVYTCTDGHWTLKAPDAKLLDEHGLAIGTHFAGPTWRLTDGSEVKGKAIASRPASDGSSVPSLLLEAVPGSGTGKLANVTYITRTDTHGGAADTKPCVSGEARVPYTANYGFYTGKR